VRLKDERSSRQLFLTGPGSARCLLGQIHRMMDQALSLMDEIDQEVPFAIAVLEKFTTTIHSRSYRLDPVERGTHLKTPAVERFVPDRISEKPLLLAFYPLAGCVPGEDEHRQEQAAADYGRCLLPDRSPV